MDEFDLEAEMMRSDAAQARVNNGIPHAPHRNAGKPSLVDPDTYAAMARTAWLQQNNPEAVHDWLLDLENQCINLLPPEHQERFRASQ